SAGHERAGEVSVRGARGNRGRVDGGAFAVRHCECASGCAVAAISGFTLVRLGVPETASRKSRGGCCAKSQRRLFPGRKSEVLSEARSRGPCAGICRSRRKRPG